MAYNFSMETERSFFNPRLPVVRTPGRGDALFDQYYTSLRNAGLGALGGGTLAGIVGYLVGKRLSPASARLSATVATSLGLLPGFVGGGHLTYESMRDTIPPTKKELREQDPVYRIKRLLKYKGV